MNSIKYLTEEELQRFKKEARKSKLHDLAFDLTLTYGLRVQELVNLKLEDFEVLEDFAALKSSLVG